MQLKTLMMILALPLAAIGAEPPTAAEISASTQISTATIHTPHGDIHVRLFPKTAPIAVANFAKLARAGFYDQLAFHRVVADFVIQGGDPLTRPGAPETGLPPGSGGAGYSIPAEVGPSNPEPHTPGTLAMADSGLGTASSQFYLTLVATPFLDGRYTVFGRVVDAADLAIIRQVRANDRFSVVIDQ
jgi:cyclophilin family peptidyl-prolyl cis-trans isomerase